ncbi:hypothetical protein [Bosea sp. RAC05]|uniref:hypothetical protein n=1 Tax=Bosea sp. RAC05 TaxID=1842539 RepID=UPI0014956DA9|nr:hypothetical protein [Bosea sp. RAC05]
MVRIEAVSSASLAIELDAASPDDNTGLGAIERREEAIALIQFRGADFPTTQPLGISLSRGALRFTSLCDAI